MNIPINAIRRRVFNKTLLDKHVKDFMLGQTVPYLNKNKITIDIGAATGMYSSFFSKHSLEVHSFEALEIVFRQLLETSFKYNNIIPKNYAISNEEGFLTFYVDDKRLSNNSFYNLVEGQKTKVETKTLDSFKFKNVGFIKIDVEGAELSVIHGGLETIQKNRPNMMIEIYPKFLPEGDDEEIFKMFMSEGYKVYYNVKGSGLRLVSNLANALEVARNPDMIDIHDGDFLFTWQ